MSGVVGNGDVFDEVQVVDTFFDGFDCGDTMVGSGVD